MSLEDRKKIVVIPVGELLRPLGFRKSAMSFYAVREGATLVVSLQSSTGSTQNALKITCNTAIQLHELADRSRRDFSEFHWRQRIGFFLSPPSDIWWTCVNDDDAHQAGREIAALLRDSALPELEQLASPRALAALWKSGISPGLTAGQRTDALASLVAAGHPLGD